MASLFMAPQKGRSTEPRDSLVFPCRNGFLCPIKTQFDLRSFDCLKPPRRSRLNSSTLLCSHVSTHFATAGACSESRPSCFNCELDCQNQRLAAFAHLPGLALTALEVQNCVRIFVPIENHGSVFFFGGEPFLFWVKKETKMTSSPF